jgi:hypothetical protein
MFRDDIPYGEARRRGRIQTAILDELTAGVASLEAVDFGRAEQLVGERLSPIPEPGS